MLLGKFLRKKTKDSPSGQGVTSPISANKETTSTVSPVSSKHSDRPQSTITAATSVTSPASSTNGPIEIKAEPISAPAPAPATSAAEAAPESAPTMEKVVPRQTKGKYTLTDFNFERTLGTGSFGRVQLVQSKHNQRYYAVKVLKKQQVVKMKQVEHTNDERRMLQRVKHPFLITLWGTFQDTKNLYMVMDFIEGGELFSLLRKSQVRRQLFKGLVISGHIPHYVAYP